ncbi:hypothetical protein ACH5RR_026189 [Cinchona calisaya]|uniref:Uncharacterized protein n=1 Tax=Cinchona calisaya TaxID=153742 RepID=A0ABD2Z521_9GENT
MLITTFQLEEVVMVQLIHDLSLDLNPNPSLIHEVDEQMLINDTVETDQEDFEEEFHDYCVMELHPGLSLDACSHG